MAKFKIVILVSFFLIVSVSAEAQFSQKQKYLTDSIEMSLMGLRQKAQDIHQRNQWLQAQIKNYQMTVPVKNVSSPMRVEGAFFGDTSNTLNQKIYQTSQEIEHLKKQLAVFEEAEHVQTEGSYSQENEQLVEQVRKAKVQVEQSESYLDELREKYGRRSEVYQSLLEKQRLLKQKQDLLKNELNLAVDESEKLQDALLVEERSLKEIFEEENQTVIQLREDSGMLEKTLGRAQRKIKNKDIDFTITDDEIEQLMENLVVIKNEQTILQNEYSRLSDNLKDIQKGGWPLSK